MHAVGQPPFDVCDDGIDDSMFHYLTEANIPYELLFISDGSRDNTFAEIEKELNSN